MLREPVWRDLRLVERGIARRPGGPGAQPVRRRLGAADLDDDLAETQDEVAALLAGRRARAARVRGTSSAEIAELITPLIDTTPPGPARLGPRDLRRLAGLRRCAARNRGADLRRAVPVRHLGDPVPRRSTSTSEQVLRGARLARDQRLDRRAVDPGHRLRPAPRPRLRAGRRRDPPVGVRPRRDRPADRGDGRRGARGRGRRSAPGRRSSAIVVEDGRAVGVALADGEQVRAARVLSNADPKTTFLGLVGRGLLPERFRGRRARLPLRGHEHEDQPRRRPAAGRGGGRRRRRPAVPPRDHGGQPDRSPRWTPAQAEARAGRPGARPAHRALHPDGPRPVAGARGQARGHDRRQLPALHARRGRAGTTLRDEVADRAIAKLDALLPGPRRTRSSSARCSPRPTSRRCSGSGAATPCTARWRSTSSSTCARSAAGPTTGPRSRDLWLCGAGTHPGGGVTGANGRNCAREVIRDRAGCACEAAGCAPVSPLIPPEWESIEAPAIAVEPPGPRSREILARIERHGLPGPQPRADAAGARLQARLDGHRRRRQRLPRLRLGLGLGAARRRARRSCSSPAIEALRAVRQRGQPRARLRADRRARRAPAGDRAAEPISRYDIALNGTEAVEIAIKMMRRATGRPVILGFHGSYHGESTLTAALGAEAAEISRGLRGLGRRASSTSPTRIPTGRRCATRGPGGSGDATVDYIRDHLLFHALDPSEVAGVMIEPVLGSGGCVAPPDSFWPALIELCREHGWLLCADEVKIGDGPLGRAVRGRALGRRARPDLPRQGARRRRDADRRPARLRAARWAASTTCPPAAPGHGCPPRAPRRWRRSAIFEREPVLENVRELERVGAARLGELAERFDADRRRARGRLLPWRSSSSPTARRKERDPELQDAVAAEACRRGVLADSSTTSLNIQPSLVMPPAALERALEIVAESIEAALAAPAR